MIRCIYFLKPRGEIKYLLHAGAGDTIIVGLRCLVRFTASGGGDMGMGSKSDGDWGNELKFDWFGVRFVIEYTPLVFLPFLRSFGMFHCTERCRCIASTSLIPSAVVHSCRHRRSAASTWLAVDFSLYIWKCTFLHSVRVTNSCAIKDSLHTRIAIRTLYTSSITDEKRSYYSSFVLYFDPTKDTADEIFYFICCTHNNT